MTQNTSIYWKDEETAKRARWMAEAKGLSVSAFLSNLVNERYKEMYPESAITAHCTICGRETEFVFLAYWAEQSDLYQCADCGKVRQKNDLAGDGEKPIIEKMEAVS